MTGEDHDAERQGRQGGVLSVLASGVLARCPRCGGGALFKNGLMLRPKCEACSLDYAFIDTGDGPAVFAILILGFVVLGAALFVEFRFGPPVWVHALLWGILTPLFAFGLLRFLKAILIALQWLHKAEEGRLAKD
ncbi:DUF983 domain-containing protein [Hyphomicrobium sp.]|uniref:DUF983 domain-containing protein n=1 Tax=Hyphomicrobium sp. TaxID=82 RepID=UPI003F7170E8